MGIITRPVQWTTRTTKDLEKITRFNVNLYGSKKALEISTDIRKSTEILESTDVDLTEYGAIDLAFNHLKHEYRKLINNHVKITYRIGRTKVFIVRVFDTRQHPNKNR